MSRKRPAKVQKKEEQDEDVECSQAKQFMTEKPSKEPKKEEPDEEDIKDIHEGTATGSVSYHIKGQILPEQLMHRNLHNCEYCEFSAQTDDRLVAHREQKHKIYLCRFCKSEFASKFTQYKHYTTCADLLAMRSKVKKQCAEIKDRSHTQDCIRCMHIKIVFANMFDLGDHRQHPCKQYSAKLFACNGCKVQFTTANGLKSHLIAKYNERDFKCYNTGMLCYENMKIPKYTRSRAQASDEKPLEGMQNSVTLSLVPIKDEPTLPDEMHDDQKKQALVASHLLSEYDGTIAGEYYNAMRKMFYHVVCPFCGVECRTHSALHTHALIHHPPHERCLYQCRGCSLTFQTPTGLAQHLKREFDESNPVCYNTVSLVRKEDYLGPLTGWSKKTWNMRKKMPRCHPDNFRTVDVKTETDEEDDRVKKEEADDGYEDPAGTRLRFPMNQSSMKGDREVKMEPEDEIKQETRD